MGKITKTVAPHYVAGKGSEQGNMGKVLRREQGKTFLQAIKKKRSA